MSLDPSPSEEQWASQAGPLLLENKGGIGRAFGPGQFSNRMAASAPNDALSAEDIDKKQRQDALLRLLGAPGKAKGPFRAPDSVQSESMKLKPDTVKDSLLESHVSTKVAANQHGNDSLHHSCEPAQKKRKVILNSFTRGQRSWDPRAPFTRKVVQISKDQQDVIDRNDSWFHLIPATEENAYPLIILAEDNAADDQNDSNSEVSWPATQSEASQAEPDPEDITIDPEPSPLSHSEKVQVVEDPVPDYIQQRETSRESSVLTSETRDSSSAEPPAWNKDLDTSVDPATVNVGKIVPDALITSTNLDSSAPEEDELEVEVPGALQNQHRHTPAGTNTSENLHSSDPQIQSSPLVDRTPYPKSGLKRQLQDSSQSHIVFQTGRKDSMHFSSSASSDAVIPGTFDTEHTISFDRVRRDVTSASTDGKIRHDHFLVEVDATLIHSTPQSEIVGSPSPQSVRSQPEGIDQTTENMTKGVEDDSQHDGINLSRSLSPNQLKMRQILQHHLPTYQDEEERSLRHLAAFPSPNDHNRTANGILSHDMIPSVQTSSSIVYSPSSLNNRRSRFGFSQEEHGEMDTDEMVKANRRLFLQQLNADSRIVSKTSSKASSGSKESNSLVTDESHLVLSGAQGVERADSRKSSEVSGEDTMKGSNVFELFKQAYPSYQESSKNFVRACAYLEWLMAEKKAPPFYLWDDFIRVFSGEYRQYVDECRSGERKPTSCAEFYNARFRGATFAKEILSPDNISEALLLDVEQAAELREKFLRKSRVRDERNFEASPSIQSQLEDSSNTVDEEHGDVGREKSLVTEVEPEKHQSSPSLFPNRIPKRPYFETPSQIASDNGKRRKVASFVEERTSTEIDRQLHLPRPCSPILGEEPLELLASPEQRNSLDKRRGRISLDPRSLLNLSELAKRFIPRRKRVSSEQD